jgi:hypothetical protein
MAAWVPYLSVSGRLISSQKMTSHLLAYLGTVRYPWLVFLVSQYCSNVLRINSGVVDDEKLMKIISMSCTFLRVAIRVMVLPDPGGPQSKNGLFSWSQEHRTS